MDTFDRELELVSDAWLGYARGVLSLGGFAYAAMAVLLGPMLSLGFWSDPNVPTGLAVTMTVVFCLVNLVVAGACSAAQFVASSGLAAGKKWAWFLGLVIGVIYLGSCTCFPFGGVILFGLLNDRTRKLFLTYSGPGR